MSIKKIQLYGERCTGTNYFEHLLSRNFPEIEIKWDFGLKHFFYEGNVSSANETLFLVLYRNPFNWVRSLYRKPWRVERELRNKDFSDFISSEWVCIWDEDASVSPDNIRYGTEILKERDPVTGNRFGNVLKMRSAKISNWQSLQGLVKNFSFWKYEEIVSSPEDMIMDLADQFGMHKKLFFRDVNGYGGSRKKFKQISYPDIAPADLEFIVEQLDHELEKSIGYVLPAAKNMDATTGGTHS